MKTNENLLEIRNLHTYFFTNKGTIKAVNGVDMEIQRGRTLGVVGESGSGKSVSMLALMGLLPWTAQVTAEKMSFDGRDLLKMDGGE